MYLFWDDPRPMREENVAGIELFEPCKGQLLRILDKDLLIAFWGLPGLKFLDIPRSNGSYSDDFRAHILSTRAYNFVFVQSSPPCQDTVF